MSFSEKLQQLRKANKMSQEQLADMLDVTRQSVSKWESGTTYPEMDKLIALCKIFKCSLDDLTNDEISEINVEKKEEPVINGIVGNIAEIINKSIKMIKAMSAGQLIGLIFTMSVIGVLLLLLRIPFSYLEKSFYNLMITLGNNKFAGFSTGLFNMVLDIIYFALYILAFVYIYKVAYLDRYEFVKSSPATPLENEEVVETKEEIKEETRKVKEVKIIEKEVQTPNPVFKFLGSVALWCIRGLVAFICIPFILTLFFLFFGEAVVLKLAFDGVFFLSIFMALLFAIVLNIWYLETCIIFIFNRKYSFKRIFWTFIIGVCGLGCSLGFTALELTDITFVNETPKFIEKSTVTESFDMRNDLSLDIWAFYSPDVKYVVNENIDKKVEVSVDFYDNYSNIKIVDNLTEIGFNRYYYSNFSFFDKNFWNEFKENLKNRTIYNYEKMNEVVITVRASSNNIETIKANTKKKADERNRYVYSDCSAYVYEINQNETEIDELNREIESLKDKVESLQEYKDRVKDIIGD